MGAFQTLREQGLLPLVQVDEHGNMRWVADTDWAVVALLLLRCAAATCCRQWSRRTNTAARRETGAEVDIVEASAAPIHPHFTHPFTAGRCPRACLRSAPLSGMRS